MWRNSMARQSWIHAMLSIGGVVAILIPFLMMVHEYDKDKHIVASHEKASFEIVNVVWTENPLVGNFTIVVNDKKKIEKTMECRLPLYAKNEQQNCIFHLNATFWAYFDAATNDVVFSIPNLSEYIFPTIVFVGILVFMMILSVIFCNEYYKHQKATEMIQI